MKYANSRKSELIMVLRWFLLQGLSAILLLVQETEQIDYNFIGNISTRNVECPQGLRATNQLCYELVENTPYPYQCPFRDNLPFDEHNSFLVNLILLRGAHLWLDVKRNPDHGYYEWQDLGDNYGTLFDRATYSQGDCILSIFSTHSPTQFTVEDCSSTHTALCIYAADDTNYCDAFDAICNAGEVCHCQGSSADIFCASTCASNSHRCMLCAHRFARHPSPIIDLRFNRHSTVIVTITNPLTLADLNYGLPVYCFSDVYEPTTSTIKYKYHRHEITLLVRNSERVLLRFDVRQSAPGRYWCEGFQLPNFNKVTSNGIIAGRRENYGFNFVLNLTLAITSSHTFMPYNIHTTTTNLINAVLSGEHFHHPILPARNVHSVRPVQIFPLCYECGTVDMLFHFTAQNWGNVGAAYEELLLALDGLTPNSEVMNYSMASSDLCIRTTTNANIVWPTIRLGQRTPPLGLHLQKNGLPIIRGCLGEFTNGARWSEVSGEVATGVQSQVTQALYDLLHSNETAENLNRQLANIIADIHNIIPHDVYLIASNFQRIAQSGERFDLYLFTQNLNTVMGIEGGILRTAQLELNATDVMLYNYDLALSTIPGIYNGMHRVTTIETENIMAQVTNLKTTNITGIAIYDFGGNLQFRNLTSTTSVTDLDPNGLRFAAFIPPLLLKQILKNMKHKEVNLITATFLDDALFNSDGTKNSISTIISMFIPGFNADILDEPIPIIFREFENVNREKYCGYWNYGINDMWISVLGQWERDSDAAFNTAYKMCNYSHMTHFALLAGAPNSSVLNYIALVGCILSLLGVAGIIITALVFKSWRECMGTKILLNFSATIVIQMTFLFIAELNDLARTLCITTAVVLHYIIISQFCWMLVISYLQYRKFVLVLVNEPSNVLIKSCIFSWMLPIMPVVIVASVDIDSYFSNQMCYLSGIGLYFGLFLPIGFVIVINLILYVLILTSVLYQKTRAFGVKQNLSALKIKLGIVLFFLMGFSWIFGLLAGFLDSIVLSYLFCITSTVQGLVMYFHFIIFNKTTRKLWLRKLRCMKNALGNGDEKGSSAVSKVSVDSEAMKTSKSHMQY